MIIFDPTLQQLRYLVALKDCGSSESAGDKCNVTSLTVMKAIRSLNILFGTDMPIYVKSKHKAEMTDFGNNLAEEAREVLASVDKLKASVREQISR